MNEKTTGGRGGRGPSSPPRGKGASGDEGPRNPGTLGPASPGAEAPPVRGTGPTAGGDPRDGGSGAGPGGRAGAVRGAEAAQRSPAETPRSAGWGGGPGSGRLPRPGRGSTAAVPAPFPACSRGRRALAVQPDPSRHSRATGGRGAQQPPAPGSESAEPGPCRAVPVGCSDTRVPESSKHGPHGPTWRRAGAPARAAALTGGGRLKGGMVSEQATLRAAGPGSPSLRQPQALALPRA